MNKKTVSGIIAILLFIIILPFLADGWFFDRTKMQPQPEIVLLGDSIFGEEREETSVPALLSGLTGKTVFCGALGGTTLSRINGEQRSYVAKDVLSMSGLTIAITQKDFGAQKSVYTKENGTDYFQDTIEGLSQVDFSKVKILFLNHGLNDYHAGVVMENPKDPYDVYTFAGALRTNLTGLKKAYPDLRIILVTPTYTWYNKPGAEEVFPGVTMDRGNGTLEDYAAKEIAVAEELGVEVLDVIHDFYTDEDPGDCWKYTLDGIHPNALGREMLAEAMADILE